MRIKKGNRELLEQKSGFRIQDSGVKPLSREIFILNLCPITLVMAIAKNREIPVIKIRQVLSLIFCYKKDPQLYLQCQSYQKVYNQQEE